MKEKLLETIKEICLNSSVKLEKFETKKNEVKFCLSKTDKSGYFKFLEKSFKIDEIKIEKIVKKINEYFNLK